MYQTNCFALTQCNGLEGDVAQYAANQTQENGGKPFLFTISVLGSYMCITVVTNKRDQWLYIPSEGHII